jgi:hypothetical protein
VVAEDLHQRRLQDVGGGVVEGGGLALAGIDLEVDASPVARCRLSTSPR